MSTLSEMAETAQKASEMAQAAEPALRKENFVMGTVVVKGPDGEALDQPMWYPDAEDAAVKAASESTPMPWGLARSLGATRAEKPADKPGKADKS